MLLCTDPFASFALKEDATVSSTAITANANVAKVICCLESVKINLVDQRSC